MLHPAEARLFAAASGRRGRSRESRAGAGRSPRRPAPVIAAAAEVDHHVGALAPVIAAGEVQPPATAAEIAAAEVGALAPVIVAAAEIVGPRPASWRR